MLLLQQTASASWNSIRLQLALNYKCIQFRTEGRTVNYIPENTQHTEIIYVSTIDLNAWAIESISVLYGLVTYFWKVRRKGSLVKCYRSKRGENILSGTGANIDGIVHFFIFTFRTKVFGSNCSGGEKLDKFDVIYQSLPANWIDTEWDPTKYKLTKPTDNHFEITVKDVSFSDGGIYLCEFIMSQTGGCIVRNNHCAW